MSVELIQRWGRWASQAFQAYLWESPEDARGVAAKMVRSPSSLSVTRNLRGGVRSNFHQPRLPRAGEYALAPRS